MKNTKRELGNITFEDYVDFSYKYDEVCVYLDETFEIDKIAGLHSTYKFDKNGDYIGTNDHFKVNYYATYNYVTNNFYVDACVTVYCDMEEIRELYPDISDKLIDYYCNNNYSHATVDFTREELDIIFEKFKKYVCEDLKDEYDGKSFEEIILNVKNDLNK